jgi:hypothetical protein
MEIRNRKQILFTFLYPCFPLRILAFGAMTVAATIVGNADMSTLITTILVSAQYSSAAMPDSP